MVIVTVMVSSMSLLATTALPLASLPSLTRTTRTWTGVVSWSRAALVRSWPVLDDDLEEAPDEVARE